MIIYDVLLKTTIRNLRHPLIKMALSKRIVRAFLYVTIGIYLYLCWFALTNYDSHVRTTTLDFSQIPPLNAGLQKGEKPYCYVDTTTLGRVDIDLMNEVDIKSIEKENPEVQDGGSWAPLDCRSIQRIAILIPYRDRYHHLKHLLSRLHPMLRRQKIEYRIFLMEQVAPEQFNRGMLMNVGHAIAQQHGAFSCFVFHDADLYPLNDQNLYLCDADARHLAGAIDETRFHVMYYNYLGGVSALSAENVLKVNGYSNLYWGWGSEDDDFSARTREAGLALTRPPTHVALFRMARHVKASAGADVFDMFISWKSRWKKDGVNSLSSYDYKTTLHNHKLYTNITVDLGHPPDRSSIDESEVVSWYWFFKFYGYLP